MMGKGCEIAALTGLRSLAVVFALAVIGVGAWVLHTINDVEVRGNVILDMRRLEQGKEEQWRALFDIIVNSQIRIWVAVAGGSFAFLAVTYIFLSSKIDRLKTSRYILVPLEFLSMLAMAAAFGAALSLAIKLEPSCPNLDTSSSADLESFKLLCPLTKGYSIAGGVGLFLLAITSLAAIVDACSRARTKKICSFEPTASALGMGHGYQAVAPPMPRTTIPTLYDPRKPIPGSPAQSPKEEESQFANAGAVMGRRDSGLSVASKESGMGISGPLGLERPEAVQQMRPARPWSEMPRKR